MWTPAVYVLAIGPLVAAGFQVQYNTSTVYILSSKSTQTTRSTTAVLESSTTPGFSSFTTVVSSTLTSNNDVSAALNSSTATSFVLSPTSESSTSEVSDMSSIEALASSSKTDKASTSGTSSVTSSGSTTDSIVSISDVSSTAALTAGTAVTSSETTSSPTSSSTFPPLTMFPIMTPISSAEPTEEGSNNPCPMPWYLWYLNWMCDIDSGILGFSLNVPRGSVFPFPGPPPSVDLWPMIHVTGELPKWYPPLTIDENGLPVEPANKPGNPDDPDDPDDCEPEITSICFVRTTSSVSISDTITATATGSTSSCIDTTIPCSMTATGETTTVATTTSAPSCALQTPASPAPETPTESPETPVENMRRGDAPCPVTDFFIYPVATDPRQPSYRSLMSYVSLMKTRARGKCDYSVGGTRSADYVAFIYIRACPVPWLAFFLRNDLRDRVAYAYDWVKFIEALESTQLRRSVPVSKRSGRSISHDELQSRSLEETWTAEWARAQISATGPYWLRDESDIYKERGVDEYAYDHDSSAGEGQVIYIVDEGSDTSNEEEFDQSRMEKFSSGFEMWTDVRAIDGTHGPKCAALAVGQTVSLAPKATLAMFESTQWATPPTSTTYSTMDEYYLQGLFAVIDDLEAKGRRNTGAILNLSWNIDTAWVPRIYGSRMFDLLRRISDDYGVLILNSVGNGAHRSTDDSYPTKFLGQIRNLQGVGATDKNGYRARFSRLPQDPTAEKYILYGPGMDVQTLEDNLEDYEILDGTSFATALGASLAAYIQGWAAANNVQLKPIRGVLLGLARELASNPALTNVDYSEVQATNEKKRLMFNGGDCLSLTNLRLQRCLGVRRVLMDTGPACTTRNLHGSRVVPGETAFPSSPANTTAPGLLTNSVSSTSIGLDTTESVQLTSSEVVSSVAGNSAESTRLSVDVTSETSTASTSDVFSTSETIPIVATTTTSTTAASSTVSESGITKTATTSETSTLVTSTLSSGTVSSVASTTSDIPTSSPTEPETTTTEAPQPYTETEINGDVLAYPSRTVEYGKVGPGVQITMTHGLGQPVTIATPVPTQTDGNKKGAGSCRNIDDACDRAYLQYDDDIIYTEETSYVATVESGMLWLATVGTAGCTAMFSCDDYGIGMSGKNIKDAVNFLKENNGADKCGTTYLSNTCQITLNYCTSCKAKHP